MTGGQVKYLIALFKSVSYVIKAETVLKEAHIPHKIIPVPKTISTECGVCIRFLPGHRDSLEKALHGDAGIVEISELR